MVNHPIRQKGGKKKRRFRSSKIKSSELRRDIFIELSREQRKALTISDFFLGPHTSAVIGLARSPDILQCLQGGGMHTRYLTQTNGQLRYR